MLRRAKTRVEHGEKWKDVAEDMDVNVSTLRKQIHQHLGKIDRSNSPKRFLRESMLIEAIRLRNTELMSYPIIRDRVGWPRTTVALEQAIRRYASHHEIEVYKGFPNKRRCRWENNDE